MFIVTNTIKIEKDQVEQVVARFNGGHAKASITGIDGFLGFEIWQKKGTSPDFSEIVVTSRWDSEKQQKAWLKTEGFKKAHGRTPDTREQHAQRNGIISNEIAEFETVLTQEPIILD
ncbi:antibiotic biosynthesis monooxygenase [Carnobacterium gallinarum]|uniref:antibiotic biosynthesis monooxygenase n=1 Tax=Carnobacterium gallinarum TaxID=2749 RepID=UPI00054D34B9|nr:antibiotic biosynthesis monooxygenase [Carnobacterium gallinarum]